jgi:hypothetical protein
MQLAEMMRGGNVCLLVTYTKNADKWLVLKNVTQKVRKMGYILKT